MDSEVKQHLSFETEETDVDRTLGDCSSKLPCLGTGRWQNMVSLKFDHEGTKQ
jgi:hypothetical protein